MRSRRNSRARMLLRHETLRERYEHPQLTRTQARQIAAQHIAMQHPNRLGAGAVKRKHLIGQQKFNIVMAEYARGTLHSGSGQIVTDRRQALAIAYSEKRKHEKS